MIQLNKIPYTKALLLQASLKHYVNVLKNSDRLTEMEKISLSIAEEMYYKYLPKFNKQHPPRIISFKMLWHQGLVIFKAFVIHQKEFFTTDLDHAIIDNLKMELHRQIC